MNIRNFKAWSQNVPNHLFNKSPYILHSRTIIIKEKKAGVFKKNGWPQNCCLKLRISFSIFLERWLEVFNTKLCVTGWKRQLWKTSGLTIFMGETRIGRYLLSFQILKVLHFWKLCLRNFISSLASMLNIYLRTFVSFICFMEKYSEDRTFFQQ